jgi:ArsR family transcriptional regulator
MRVRELPDPDHLPALDPRYAIERPALDLGPLDHPPRILLLYASLRARSFSRAARSRMRLRCCRNAADRRRGFSTISAERVCCEAGSRDEDQRNLKDGANEGRIISIHMEIVLDARQLQDRRISMKVEKAAKQLEALGNPTRLQVYRMLVRAGDGGLPVGRLQDKLGIAASTLSHHLHRLILTGLVTQERQATTLICRANYPAMNGLVGFLVDECCQDAGCAVRQDEAAA